MNTKHKSVIFILLLGISLGFTILFFSSGGLAEDKVSASVMNYTDCDTNITLCQELDTDNHKYCVIADLTDILANGQCLDINNAENITLYCGNKKITDASGDAVGIKVWTNTKQVNNTVIYNCQVELFDTGISINGSNISVVNSNASTNSEIGIYVETTDANLSYNTIDSNTGGANSLGIYLNDADSSTISHNKISNQPEYGIWMVSTDACTLNSNNLSRNNVSLLIDANSDSNRFTNNRIFNNTIDIKTQSAAAATNNNNFTSLTTLFGATDTISSFSYIGSLEINATDHPGTAPSGYNDVDSKAINITNQTNAWIYLNISYTSAELTASGIGTESTIRLFDYDGASWTKVSGSSVDTTNNYAYGNVTSFSILGSFGYTISSYYSGSSSGGGRPVIDCDGAGCFCCKECNRTSSVCLKHCDSCPVNLTCCETCIKEEMEIIEIEEEAETDTLSLTTDKKKGWPMLLIILLTVLTILSGFVWYTFYKRIHTFKKL